MRTNGTRIYEYDDENQLVNTWVSGVSSNWFSYDGKMRRRITRDYTWNGGDWILAREVHYIYDGNLVIQERDQLNVPQVAYTRGKDLSGSLEGAGGIGGLLALSMCGSVKQQQCYYHADGNGNVTALVSTNQQVVARYLYDPFGNTLSASGPMADGNLYRFSSKEIHPASGLVYYLYRFYDPSLQRWPNRDPLNELGFRVPSQLDRGINLREERSLYRFVANNPIRYWDFLGLDNPGCDKGTGKPLCPTQKERDCRLRCCAEHDKCYHDNQCSASSWVIEGSPECAACNAAAGTCVIMCKLGIGPPTGPRWYCPNGPDAGKFYDDYSQIPASCWKNGTKPPNP